MRVRRRRSWLLPVALLALAPASAAMGAGWADDPESVSDPAYAGSRALCQAAQSVPLPRPDAGATEAPKGCSSERLAYGIGMPADSAAARRCALQEQARDPRNDRPFAGTAMLMTLAANGEGGPRDPSLALALACLLAGAPAEMDGRVNHLAAFRKDGPGPVPFSFCDDVTSGLYQGECAAHDSAIATVGRDASVATLAARLPAGERAAFDAARAAAEAFSRARGTQETDLGGSARAVFEIEAEDAVRDDFRDAVQRLVAGTLPAAAPAKRDADDAALNTAYRAVMAVDDPQWGTPTKDGIRATQRLWLAYRDALAQLASAHGGPAAADRIVDWLTRRRTKEMTAFLS